MLPLPIACQLSMGVAFSVVLALAVSCPQEAVILTNFFAVYVVNCLLPLSIPVCTGMFLLELLTWEEVFRILAVVWLAGTACSYFVHLVLYRCL